MAGLNKIEGYLIDLGLSYEEVSPNTWVVEDPTHNLPPMVISLSEPVVVIRATVTTLKSGDNGELFRELLKLNAGGVLYGAYALSGDDIVLIDTHEYGSMDKEEFEASIDSIGFALTEHYPLLSRFAAK